MLHASVMASDSCPVPPSAPLRASVRGVLCLTACTGTPSCGKAASSPGLISVSAAHQSTTVNPILQQVMKACCAVDLNSSGHTRCTGIAGAYSGALAAGISGRQHKAEYSWRLAAPEGRAVSECLDQPPSTLILLAGPAPPAVSSASAAFSTQQSGIQRHFWLEEHCTPARLDKGKTCKTLQQSTLADCVRSTQQCRWGSLLITCNQTAWGLQTIACRHFPVFVSILGYV